MAEQPKPTPPARPARRRRPTLRWCARLGIFLFVLAGASVIVVTQTGVLRSLVLPRIAGALSCDATCGRVTLTADGRLVIERLELSVRGLDNPARHFLTAPRVYVTVDWSALLGGAGPGVERIRLQDPLLRISQGQDLSLNLSALLDAGSPGAGAPAVPELHVTDGVLELGEHSDTWYTPLASLRVDGSLTRAALAPGSDDRYVFELLEMSPGAVGGVGTRVAGEADLDTGAARMTVESIDLTAWGDRAAPTTFRALWEQLDVNGVVPRAEFVYEPGAGIAVSLDLEGVRMNVPVPVERGGDEELLAIAGRAGSDAEFLRMRDVSGQVRFDLGGLSARLRGLVGDLECAVALETRGLSLDAPLTCAIEVPGFVIEERPELLPVAPAVALKIFKRFSGPTAVLAGRVTLERDPPDAPGAPGPWRYRGDFEVTEGQARYEQFPYPVSDIDARFLFDEERFEIVRLTGVGPTGARLFARGVISPPGEGAEVAVDVTVVDAPLDDVFREAMPPDRRAVFDVLFDREGYAELVDAGLVLPSAEAAAIRGRLAELDASPAPATEAARARTDAERAELLGRLEAPVFDLGGLAALQVDVRRPLGVGTRYSTAIHVALDRAGVVPDAFPYPVHAEGVELRIDEDVAEIAPVRLVGLTGAEGSIRGEVVLANQFGAGFTPAVDLEASGVPLDEFLIQALPGPRGESRIDAIEFSARDLVRALDLEGEIDCDTHISERSLGRIGFEARVTLNGLDSRPGDPSVGLGDVRGELLVTDESLRVDNITGSAKGGRFSLSLTALYPPETDDEPPIVRGEFVGTGIDLGAPIESAVGAVAPDAAETVASLRADRRPEGRVDVSVLFDVRADRRDYEVLLAGADGLAFDGLGGRIRVGDYAGLATFSGGAIGFDAVTADVAYDDDPPFRLALSGDVALGPGGPDSEALASVEGGRFESDLLARLAPATGALREAVAVRGGFDVEAVVGTGGGDDPRASWTLTPSSLELERAGVTIPFRDVAGRVVGGPDGGRLEGLVAEAEDWRLALGGDWRTTDEGYALDAAFAYDAVGLPPGPRALLPRAVDEALDIIEFGVAGPVRVDEARVRIEGDAGEARPSLRVDAELAFDGLGVRVGLPVEDGAGRATVRVERARGERDASWSMRVDADRLNLAGADVTGAEVVVASGERPDTVVVPRFAGDAYAGRLTGRAAVGPGDAPDGLGRSYEAHLSTSGVEFGPLLRALAGAEAPAPEPGGAEAPRPGPGGATDEAPEVFRGLLDARLSVTGRAADDSARRGRLTLRVQGGDVLNLPGMMPLLELSNLQPPVGETVDLAFADAFLDAGRLVFEDLLLYSPSVRITGEGEVLWPSGALDLRVQTAGATYVPLVSDVLEGLREEFVATRVTGTLYDPQFRYEQLRGARRLLDALLGGEGDGGERDETDEPRPDEDRD